ncbi:MerR family transcriptional regulator [Nocardia sp. CA-107356]|uniref:MerR family transcriptional regulator n=1 Tax=Nocardia sp. CA-107356 TaxID=3239972 RepID=UPI003D8B6022
MAVGAEFTIHELARRSGTTVRSLRVYRERGVLPPPRVQGRTGFYGPDHLNRVRAIRRLLDRGIKLNGIRELVEAWHRGDDLGDILGVPEAGVVTDPRVVAEPGAEADPDVAPSVGSAEMVVAATELAERYRDVPNGLARAVVVGLYRPVDAVSYRVADHRLIRIAGQLAAEGVSQGRVLDELERLRADCDRIAHRFIDVFQLTS